MITSSLPVLPALHLAAASVQRLADDIGVRVLFIKGVTASHQRLRREGRLAADVDVLVEAGGLRRLCEALISLGWASRRLIRDSMLTRQPHAVTLVHPSWPCDLDLHSHVPGFFAPASEAFEVLWECRTTQVQAGCRVTVPDPVSHAVVLLVNADRDMGTSKSADDVRWLAGAIADRRLSWDAVLRVASRTRSLSVLHGFASDHDLPLPEHDLSTDQLQAWTMGRGNAGRVGGFFYRFPRADTRGRISLVTWALFKPLDELRALHPELPDGWRGAFLGNCMRWRNGFRRARFVLRHPSAARTGVEGAPSVPARGDETFAAAANLPVAEFAPGEGLAGRQMSIDGANASVSARQDERAPEITETACLVKTAVAEYDHADARYVVAMPDPRRTAMPEVLVLQGTAIEVWDLVAERPGSARDIAEAVAARYGVDVGGVYPSVHQMLARIAHSGVLQVRPPGA